MRAVFFLAIWSLSACSGAPAAPAESPTAIAIDGPAKVDDAWLAGAWTITDIDGVTISPPTEAEPGPGLIFNPGQLGGYSSCNSFSGGYTLDGGTLTITNMIATERYCGETEGILFAILQAAPKGSRLGDDRLELRGNDGRIVLAKRM